MASAMAAPRDPLDVLSTFGPRSDETTTGYQELDKSYMRPARQVVTPHVHSVFPHLNLPHETY